VGSDRRWAAVIYGAGPDPDHLGSDGWTEGLAGGIDVGFGYYASVLFKNGWLCQNFGGTSFGQWFVRWAPTTQMTYTDFINQSDFPPL